MGRARKTCCMALAITGLDFYLWGHLKSVVYPELVPDVQTLEKHVHVACDAIRVQAGMFVRVRQSMM
ncbi:hypothetical protein PR048_000974 [Dryococelus australis]|uniref:Uncharacterized protein n=1 Tax=Dryococelus australis TaxID=614101 RepID=A0ABQ9IG31_9NEOP|nr:hypothetical protein PR048_000974 [Dryococelus australis]